MNRKLTLEVLEAKHWALANKRAEALAEAVARVPRMAMHAVIEKYNTDPYWEDQFDEIADQIREIDPYHSFLPENNPE